VKRTTTLVGRAAAVLLLAGAASTAVAGYASAAGEGPVPEHGHMLVTGLQFTEDGVTFRRCVDVAAGKALPVHAHHDNFHAGRGGDALRAAGNFPVPTAPLSDWASCAELEAEMRP
jgi:hypothetical protein